jgi:four helix bundle protein
MLRGYVDLAVWHKSMDLAVECYRLTDRWPTTELYGLTSQTRRAAGSVPANIAEGRGRHTTREYLRFVRIAYGSLMELETHLHLATRLGYVAEPEMNGILDRSTEVGKMLNGLGRALHSRIDRSRTP